MKITEGKTAREVVEDQFEIVSDPETLVENVIAVMQAYAYQQVKSERNKVLEEAIFFLGKQFAEYGPKEFSIREIRRLLESLKIKQP